MNKTKKIVEENRNEKKNNDEKSTIRGTSSSSGRSRNDGDENDTSTHVNLCRRMIKRDRSENMQERNKKYRTIFIWRRNQML